MVDDGNVDPRMAVIMSCLKWMMSEDDVGEMAQLPMSFLSTRKRRRMNNVGR